MSRGYYALNLKSDDLKSKVFSRGTIFLKPGVFRVSQWILNFNPNLHRQTNCQVWIRMFELPVECWEPSFLMDIAGAVGEPLIIDDKTLQKEFGTFARVLVDIDFTKSLPGEILIQRERFEFMTYLEYENLPAFYSHWSSVGFAEFLCQSSSGCIIYLRAYGGCICYIC